MYEFILHNFLLYSHYLWIVYMHYMMYIIHYILYMNISTMSIFSFIKWLTCLLVYSFRHHKQTAKHPEVAEGAPPL